MEGQDAPGYDEYREYILHQVPQAVEHGRARWVKAGKGAIWYLVWLDGCGDVRYSIHQKGEREGDARARGNRAD